mmetsp:Transcript_2747/g.3978  ORF Transcript_2747/g.3978 Transcript_2747/m.3978 type:complete len:205 (-) Transcript_2747:212-826(-)|eukprot:CAMPEP_0184737976 /NCGR_PEP_ID=MMETSP0315-20130426/728_1 /TAXON_ID=101924 /ORGANISM="Rhodosorus marinus, Strain UTEX LB 2760" /LENGTH=204 /DNA_ID=CAMNT_0027205475 /DNA_START=133 /DNA_END=747 /DNA_ORIENTATION=-
MRGVRRKVVWLLIMGLGISASVSGLNFRLAKGETLCFHEMTHHGNRILAFFEVLSWGYGSFVYLQVDSPSGKVMYKQKARSEGRVDFTAPEDGEYSFCFSGAENSRTDVKFGVNTETDIGLHDVVRSEHVSDLVYAVDRLRSMVEGARTELDSFRSREARHRKMALKNGRRVTFWGVVEVILIVGIAAAQIFRVQRFLENKRSA